MTKKQSRKLSRLVSKVQAPLLVTKAKKPLLVTKAKKPLLVPMPGTKPSSYAGELLANPRSSVKTRSAAASLLRLRALLKRLRLTNRIACSKSNRTRAQPTERWCWSNSDATCETTDSRSCWLVRVSIGSGGVTTSLKPRGGEDWANVC